jgi:hypothetical protein
MKRLNRIWEGTVLSNPGSLHNYFAWPTVTVLEDGTLAAVSSGFRLEHVCPFGKSVIAYSRDMGKTWTPPTPVIDTILDDRDAGILPLGGGDVIFTSFNNSLDFQIKNIGERKGERADYVRSYLAYAKANDAPEKEQLGSTYKFSRDGGYTWEEKLHISPVTSPHGPLLTKEGRIIYVGNAFGVSPTRLEAWEIDRQDGKMTHLGTLPPVEEGRLPSEEPHAIELKDGRLLCLIRTEHQPTENLSWQNAYDLFTLYQSTSSDGGRTWTVPVPLPTKEDSEIEADKIGAPPHLLRLSDGRLLLSCASRISPIGIRIFVSDDEGASWEGYVLTEDLPFTADMGYPATAELPDGSFYTVWYQHTDAGASPAIIRGARWTF